MVDTPTVAAVIANELHLLPEAIRFGGELAVILAIIGGTIGALASVSDDGPEFFPAASAGTVIGAIVGAFIVVGTAG